MHELTADKSSRGVALLLLHLNAYRRSGHRVRNLSAPHVFQEARHVATYIRMYTYVCVCVCVCV
jgi:hypothetical protein